MSDTLREEEDRTTQPRIQWPCNVGEHDVCNGSAQLTRKGGLNYCPCDCHGREEKEDQKGWLECCQGYSHAPWCSEYVECKSEFEHTLRQTLAHLVPSCSEQSTTSEHQPAARGGGERITVELINGVEGQCIGVNDYRICGPKPYGGGSIAKSWTTDKNDVLRAFLTPDQKHAWLADDLEVVSVKQHQSLVAERDALKLSLDDKAALAARADEMAAKLMRLLRSVKAMRMRHRKRTAPLDCDCDDCLFLQPILTTIEQRSTSE